MPDKNREARLAENRIIEREAINGRVKGLGWDEIADILRTKHQITCSRFKIESICNNGLSRRPPSNADALRKVETMRFDIIVNNFIAVFSNPDSKFNDRYKAANVLCKVSQQRATMLGLNKQPAFITATSEQAEEVARTISAVVGSIKAHQEEPDDTPANDPSWRERPSLLK